MAGVPARIAMSERVKAKLVKLRLFGFCDHVQHRSGRGGPDPRL